jgi:hypothetical protein
MKKVIRLTESDIHRIVKKSVNRILKEHRWDDNDFNEDDYDETVNYKYDEEDEGDMFGMMFGGKEETIKRFINAINMNPNSSNWDDKCDYYAAYLFRRIRNGKNNKAFQDMDITLDDVYYLWRTGNEERLKSLYKQEDEYYRDIKPKKQLYAAHHDDYIGNRNDSLDFAHQGKDDYDFFKDNNIEMDRNLNIYDNGYKGKASLYAQKNDDLLRGRAARNLGTTMRQSKRNFEKNR